MKLRNIRSKLSIHLRPKKHPDDHGNEDSTRYPDLNGIASTMQPQPGSSLMKLPLEIRNAIFEELWKDAGISQHIMFRNGRYTSAVCFTNHSASTDLMEECAKFQTSRFEHQELWRRLASTWGNHWMCEEFYQGAREFARSPSLFLTLMLVCRQMYIECRASIYSTVTLVIHDIETLYNFTVCRRLPIIDDVKYLNIAMRLPVRRESKKAMSPQAHATMSRWRECCQALGRTENLTSVDIWLDTEEPCWRAVLSSVPEGNANPFVFSDSLAKILTVDLPVNPERPERWQAVADVKPRFTIRARGWPAFRAEEGATTTPNTIIRLWESAEPGVPQPPSVFGTHYAHPRLRHVPI